MNGSRRARVAKGSGRPISEVNRLLEQFREMQKMMKKVAGGGQAGGKMRMPPGMFGGSVEYIRGWTAGPYHRVRSGNAGVRDEPGAARAARSPHFRRLTEMAVKIRLRRVGRKKAPMYRIVVADSKSPRDGKFIEIVGQYQPAHGRQGAQSQQRSRQLLAQRRRAAHRHRPLAAPQGRRPEAAPRGAPRPRSSKAGAVPLEQAEEPDEASYAAAKRPAHD